jgi:hypothetical protein
MISKCTASPLNEIVVSKPGGAYKPSAAQEDSGTTIEAGGRSYDSASDNGEHQLENIIIENFIDNVEHAKAPENNNNPGVDMAMILHSPESHPFDTVAAMGDYHSRLQRVGKSVPEDQICCSADRPSWSISHHKIDLSKRKKKINSWEKMLCTAFIEFYRGLGLLKSYRLHFQPQRSHV